MEVVAAGACAPRAPMPIEGCVEVPDDFNRMREDEIKRMFEG